MILLPKYLSWVPSLVLLYPSSSFLKKYVEMESCCNHILVAKYDVKMWYVQQYIHDGQQNTIADHTNSSLQQFRTWDKLYFTLAKRYILHYSSEVQWQEKHVLWRNETQEKQHDERMNARQPVQLEVRISDTPQRYPRNAANGWDREKVDEKLDEYQEWCNARKWSEDAVLLSRRLAWGMRYDKKNRKTRA